MWLKDYGIEKDETIKVKLNKVYRNSNKKLVGDFTILEDYTSLQANLLDKYEFTPVNREYLLRCTGLSRTGFPYIELDEVKDFEKPLDSIIEEVNKVATKDVELPFDEVENYLRKREKELQFELTMVQKLLGRYGE